MLFKNCDLLLSLRQTNLFASLLLITFSVMFLFAVPIISRAQSATVHDGHGKEWRQLGQTAGLSWNQIAQVCPQDGSTRCSGSVNNVNLNEWTWATDVQVLQLMSYFEPDMATNRAVSGMQYFFTGQTFLSAFQPTFSSCQTYSCSAYGAGWTSTKDDAKLPVFGAVSWGNTPVSIGGSFGVGPDSNVDNRDNFRGAWLWRDPNGIFANDDYGQVDSPDGGTAVQNVLSNDRIGGVQANFSNVVITQESSTNSGITLEASNGSVSVSGGTPAGTYLLVYKMCTIADATFCDNGTVTVLVNPYTVDAVNDYGIISPSIGGTAIPNVLVNDTFSRRAANLGNVSLSFVSVSPNNGDVTLDLSDGSVDVARGTAVGSYAVVYRICAIVDPAFCDQATATVLVQKYSIDAVNDYVRASSKYGSTPLNVLANDTFNGGPATTSTVKVSQVSAAIPGITLNTSTGWVTIASKTSSGTYNLVYKICEINDPTNCDTATATIELSGRSLSLVNE
jgi:hypothetical protein